MNYSKLKILIEENNFSINSISDKIGMTGQGLGAAIKNDTLKVRDIEKIAEVLGVSVTIFFERDATSNIQVQNNMTGGENTINIGECIERVKGLEALIDEKERTIQEKERLIQILMRDK